MANFLFALTFAVYIALVLFSMQKPPGGDYGVGHAWVHFFLTLAFLLTSLLTLISMASNGAFSWLPVQGMAQKLLLGTGWVVFVASTVSIVGMRWGLSGAPFWIRWLIQIRADIWWPLIMFVPVFLLINSGLGAYSSSGALQTFLKIAFGLNLIFCLSILWKLSARQSRVTGGNAIEYYRKTPNEEEQGRMHFIQDTIAKAMWMACHTPSSVLREQAFVQVTSVDNWEQGMMRVLESGQDYWEVYPFAETYYIDFPANFGVAMEKSIRRLAGQIREQDQSMSFQNSLEKDGLNICKLVSGLDHRDFLGQTDVRLAMRELHDALEAAPTDKLEKERKAVQQWVLSNP